MQNVGLDQVVNVKDAISHLNSFLRGEMSAVETYRQCIDKLKDSTFLGQLRDCMLSHQNRVTLLHDEIVRLGGQPAQGSGAWGAFAKLVEGGAKMFGEKAALAALEEGEDHGRDDYRRDLEDLEPTLKTFVENFLLREQIRTHDVISRLKTLH